MESAALSSLLAELFSAIQLLSAYPVPAEMPVVRFVPPQVIQERFCNGPCRVKAAYHVDEGVYVDERLDVVHNAFDRSILVHELVHHAQFRSGLFDGSVPECERISREEREAYEIQNRYLASVREMRRLPLPRVQVGCDQTGPVGIRERG